MADVPTAEESGRRILEIFRRLGRRANGMVFFSSLHGKFLDDRFGAADLLPGIQWLEDQEPKLIDSKGKPRTGPYFLTQEGFDAT